MYTIYICSMLYININHRKNRMWPTTDAMGRARVWRVCTSEYPAMPIVSIMSTIANPFSIRDCTYIVYMCEETYDITYYPESLCGLALYILYLWERKKTRWIALAAFRIYSFIIERRTENEVTFRVFGENYFPTWTRGMCV